MLPGNGLECFMKEQMVYAWTSVTKICSSLEGLHSLGSMFVGSVTLVVGEDCCTFPT